MKRLTCMSAVLALSALSAASVSAEPIIVVGDHSLLPNTPGQKISISISGDNNITGINFYAQVGDGGPELADYSLPPGIDGPAITGVDLDPPGGIFDGKGTQTDLPGIPQVAISTFDVTTGTVLGDGLLAELTLDTTGFTSGTWDLLLANVLPFSELDGPYNTEGIWFMQP